MWSLFLFFKFSKNYYSICVAKHGLIPVEPVRINTTIAVYTEEPCSNPGHTCVTYASFSTVLYGSICIVI